MPLQTTFYDKVTSIGTTQLYDLGTVRVEGNKVYKYYKAGGTIATASAVRASAQGTVSVHAANMTPIGANTTGSSFAANDYGWFQVAGEVGPLDTSGSTAAGYPLYAVDASGLLSGASASATAVGNSTVSVDSATGYGELSGLL